MMLEMGLQGMSLVEGFDLLEVASFTDGYLPGDLLALIERARQEAIVRCMSEDETQHLSLSVDDFSSAVKGYVPSSLRGVKLQKSTVNWDDIGGTSISHCPNYRSGLNSKSSS
jgi:peroxin-1